MALVLRQQKGSKLTVQEMDSNLTYLETLALDSPLTDQLTAVSSSLLVVSSSLSSEISRSLNVDTLLSSSLSFEVSRSVAQDLQLSSSIATKQDTIRRVTTAQRDAIVNPTVEYIVYNTTNNLLEVYNGTRWTSQAGYYAISGSDTIYTDSLTDEIAQGLSVVPGAGVWKVDLNAHYVTIPGNVVAIAQVDLMALYLALNNLTPTATHGLTFGSGETITAGIYTVAGAMSVAGILTLDGQNDPNSLFVFRSSGAVNTALSTTIRCINGADPANVFFLANGAIGIGADNVLVGTLLAYGAAAALGNNCIFTGRLLSTGGALAFEGGQIAKPTAESVLDVGILSNFLCFTNAGNVANTALATIQGDLGTANGDITFFSGSIFEGATYNQTQAEGNTTVFSIYANNAVVPTSIRTRYGDKYTEDIMISSVVQVQDNQPIDIRYKTNIGRVSLLNRTFTLQKLQ